MERYKSQTDVPVIDWTRVRREDETIACTARGKARKDSVVCEPPQALRPLPTSEKHHWVDDTGHEEPTRNTPMTAVVRSLDELARLADDGAHSHPSPLEPFQQLLKQEVCRADRGLSRVSLVLIEASAWGATSIGLRAILREYDRVHQVTDELMGVILPGVGTRNLRRVGARIAQLVMNRESIARLRIGLASWKPGQTTTDLLLEARADLHEVTDLTSTPAENGPGVLLWLEDLPFALPVQAEPLPKGISLQLQLPEATSSAQVRLRSSSAPLPCRLSGMSLSTRTLHFFVKTDRVMPIETKEKTPPLV